MILICFVHFNILNEHVFYIWSNALETKWGFSGMPCLISRGCAGKVVCSSLMLIPLLSLGNCINYYSPPFQVFNHILSHSYIIFKKKHVKTTSYENHLKSTFSVVKFLFFGTNIHTFQALRWMQLWWPSSGQLQQRGAPRAVSTKQGIAPARSARELWLYLYIIYIYIMYDLF